MNKPGDQGTANETRFARAADSRPGLRARRAENQAPGRDVDVTLRDGTIVPHECKWRANLNLHELIKDVQAKQPTTPPLVQWKRSSRKQGNTKRTPDGPPIVAMPESVWLEILDVLSEVAYEAPWWLARLRDRYPGLETEVG